MKFDDLDIKMRIYETSQDRCVLPGMYIVARIDGRGFTRLTKEVHKFEAPFDEKFRDLMVETVKHLMNCGFNIIYDIQKVMKYHCSFILTKIFLGEKPENTFPY